MTDTPPKSAYALDIIAGTAFRDTLVPKATGSHAGAPFWHGWALLDAFLAGAAYGRHNSVVGGGEGSSEARAIPMILTCPSCSGRHLDIGKFATEPHHTHACQHCGMVWRPALVATVGVQFLPGFKNEKLV